MHGEIERLPLPTRTMLNTNLVLDELISNIIHYSDVSSKGREIHVCKEREMHTYEKPETHIFGKREIHVCLEIHDKHLDIMVIDEGIEFDPLQVPDPDLDSPIHERPIGGLGIFIVRKLVSRMRYERRDGRNRLAVRMEMGDSAQL
ncbi:MAG: ATP-binding protein [Candidatus Cloacimonetes bacterium]|nr:ATP-binding protein [Candidatus Cloacimonadota bacterium]